MDFGSFNTQPPEGGWGITRTTFQMFKRFQHTAARRRLGHLLRFIRVFILFQHTAARRRLEMTSLTAERAVFVSTHSRPKAAGVGNILSIQLIIVSTHSRPKAAGCRNPAIRPSLAVSTHSRPKAAGPKSAAGRRPKYCFNTQPPEGGWVFVVGVFDIDARFQHTAARRRLGSINSQHEAMPTVSTHSRPKAAGDSGSHSPKKSSSFNTQPPEGGWVSKMGQVVAIYSFNTQPPEGGWFPIL